jgi:quinol-cytochrome oxidoreductase complex cytochrome b subunit
MLKSLARIQAQYYINHHEIYPQWYLLFYYHQQELRYPNLNLVENHL